MLEDNTISKGQTKKSRTVKVDRILNLITYFENGYAQDWYFAVGDYFRDQLDIKYTERAENKIKGNRWTQGFFYCFDEGQVIYDNPKAYLQWNEALKHIRFRCEILRSTPNQFDEKKSRVWSTVYKDKKGNWRAIYRFDSKIRKTIGDSEESIKKHIHGSVTFKISSPNREKTSLETIGQYDCTQFEFVDFLRTGRLKGKHIDDW